MHMAIRGITPENADTASTLAEIFEAIIRERQFQHMKYGPVVVQSQNIDGGGLHPGPMIQGPGGHELASWLLVIRKELEEAEDAAIDGRPAKMMGAKVPLRNTVRAELVQIAAVCIAALEQHGLEGSEGEQ